MYPKNGRVILHVDMNSFYASVEMAYDSSLKGKPVAIAGNPKERRGIIVTCSYEARKFGVKTTMPIWEAKRLCPQLIVREPNFDRYHTASIEMFQILRQFSHLVEPVSIDEGYVDITSCHHLGSPIQIAHVIQKRLLEKLDLPCSIGIAPNKFLAKTASDMKKPLGITILRKRDVQKVLWPRKTSEMHGIGPKTAEKLATIQVHTIGHLANANDIQLRGLLGINGIRLKERANGDDNRPVDPEAANEFKSIGNSTTLAKDTTNQQQLVAVLEKLSEKVATRMKRRKVLSLNISITIRYNNRRTITRSKQLPNPVVEQQEIVAVAKQLFFDHWHGEPIRLLGVTGNDLVEENKAVHQLDLFSYEEEAKKEPLYHTIEKLREKFGASIIEHATNKVEHEPIGKAGEVDTSFNKDFIIPVLNDQKKHPK